MQVMTRHQSDQPSQQPREKNALLVPEEVVPEPKQSTITSVPVPDEAARKDCDAESGETEALGWAPYTSELSASHSKENSGIPDGKVMSNDGEGDEKTPTESTGCRATERALCSEDMLQALCNARDARATSRGSAFHGPVSSWEVLHGGDDILSSTSFTIWDHVHEGVALQAHERKALRPRGQACTSISTES
ncbi:hypothetical protein HPB47_025461 [Ixodes persulcatus]|uniref:Uncharacterized protein n=1 Tax=Ixodes persulcatus TaxID=34615 RepID=A0AC60Q1E2_IXOPE|nr:hypothetical protein HPB47_025461 [Ixodes persulcatus]